MWRLLIGAVAFVLINAIPAEARRVALIIGNGSYKVSPLLNPTNDADAVAAALTGLGFETDLRKNLSMEAMRRELSAFGRKASGAEMAIVFYAGHGTEMGGNNYLIPVDARLDRAADIDLEAINLKTVLDQLDGATRLKLVILDACRNNIFPMAGAKRSLTRGLARVEPGGNTLVAYAAKEGTLADDGTGARNSPFTAALLKNLALPGLDIRLMFGGVRDDVLTATNGQQEPHLYGTAGRQAIYLKPAVIVPPPDPEAARKAMEAEVARRVQAERARMAAEFEAERKKVVDAGTPPAVAASPVPAPSPATPTSEAPSKSWIKDVFDFGKKEALPGYLAPVTPRRDPALSVTPGSGESFRDCYDANDPVKNRACPEMVVVPAGSFMMGSPVSEAGRGKDEGPQRRVTIARPFAVGKFEVTFDEWEVCVADGGCRSLFSVADAGWGKGRRPVINLFWDDAKQFTDWLSRQTGKNYRLLSEAEWEYAARAGTVARYPWGNEIGRGNANCDGCGSQWSRRTAPVGSFKANAWGLHDMHGNVAEWTEDCWHSSHSDHVGDVRARTTANCGPRVIRGGNASSPPQDVRSASRGPNPGGNGTTAVGFRVARSIGP